MLYLSFLNFFKKFLLVYTINFLLFHIMKFLQAHTLKSLLAHTVKFPLVHIGKSCQYQISVPDFAASTPSVTKWTLNTKVKPGAELDPCQYYQFLPPASDLRLGTGNDSQGIYRKWCQGKIQGQIYNTHRKCNVRIHHAIQCLVSGAVEGHRHTHSHGLNVHS